MWGKEKNKTLNDNKMLVDYLITLITIALLFFVIHLLSNNLGFVGSTLQRIFSFYLLIAVLILNLPVKKIIKTFTQSSEPYGMLLGGLFFIIFSFIVLLFTDQPMLWIASLPLLVSGLQMVQYYLKKPRKELHILIITSLFYSILYIFVQSIPLFWTLLNQFSLFFTNALAQIVGKSLRLGSSFSGLWIVLPFFLFSTVLFLLSTNKKRTWKHYLFSLLSLLVCWVFSLYIILFNGFEIQYLAFFLFSICLVQTMIAFSTSQPRQPKNLEIHIKRITLKKIIKNGWVGIVVFLFLSTTTLTIFPGEEHSGETNQTILLYGQHMLGTWDIPAYGTYGREASGMFGLLPLYLNAMGYHCEIAVENKTRFLQTNQPDLIIQNTTDNTTTPSPDIIIQRYVNLTDYVSLIETPCITADLLHNVDVFVVLNLNVSFSEDETNIIYDFINKGGSLLVMGDHTNVGGIQKPLNDLLEITGIQYRFDSALPLDKTFRWLKSYHFLHHPIVSQIQDPHELQISVGASLDVSLSSFPVVIGRFAFSDRGDSNNTEFAYLGDYDYKAGEQLGDIVLVAASYYGSGKILVFGDTSTFQNSAMPYSSQVMQHVFSWLSTQKTGTLEILKNTVSLLFLAAALLVYILMKKHYHLHIILPLILVVSLLCSTTLNPFLIQERDFMGDIAYIDSSHGERFTQEAFTDDSLNGLILNLKRNGYLPVFVRDFSSQHLQNGKILILNAPTQPFTHNEIKRIKDFMATGGFVILATGYTDKSASQTLLNMFDVDIQALPLGPVPYVEDSVENKENETRFVDSWPITYDQNNGVSFYSFNFTWNDSSISTYHLMVFFPYGSGGLLLISDSQYLLDKNIESIYDYWPGNIIMLKHIIDEFTEMEEQS